MIFWMYVIWIGWGEYTAQRWQRGDAANRTIRWEPKPVVSSIRRSSAKRAAAAVGIVFVTACQPPNPQPTKSFLLNQPPVQSGESSARHDEMPAPVAHAAPATEPPDGSVLMGKCRTVARDTLSAWLRHPTVGNDAVEISPNEDGSYTGLVALLLVQTDDESVTTVTYHCKFHNLSLISNSYETPEVEKLH